MPFFLNVITGNVGRICRLCSEIMCWSMTPDEEIWFHCHGCDMRDCDEETYED
jgi:hypothetical protein